MNQVEGRLIGYHTSSLDNLLRHTAEREDVFMSVEAARRLVQNLDVKIREDELGNPFFGDPSVRPFPLKREGFRLVNLIKSPRKVAFIDGGNQEILGAPNFSIQVNRIYFAIWIGKERRSEQQIPKRLEFFSATYSNFRNNGIYYDTTVVPTKKDQATFLPDEKDLSFNSLDRRVTVGTQRADIELVSSITRRFSEWEFACHVVENELEPGDVIIMDGTLQTTFANEYKYLTKLYKIAQKKEIIVTGLSKTSTLFTDTGLSLLGAVNKLADECKIEGEWYYPVAEATSKDHNVMILVVKLNKISDRVFRYEIQRDQFKQLSEPQLNEILTQLINNSTDATFPGYPYGLIDADRFARVSYDEVEYYRGIVLSQISNLGRWGKFARHILAKDSHSILNMLVG
ncbi:MAG: DNA double-strand break repair nuclease NurA [Nitrososphaerales archaeon]|nr:DNA double-strand break repair nuclease NurA [Nitrososphaerales archaeon]